MGKVKGPSELSPDSVLPQLHSLKNGTKNMRIVACGNEVIAINGDFTELGFFHYHKNSKLESGEGRAKIEISSKSNSCPISSLESLCDPDEVTDSPDDFIEFYPSERICSSDQGEERTNLSSVPSTSESSSSFRVSLKSRFNPIRKVIEPFFKTNNFKFVRTDDTESLSDMSNSCQSSVSSSPVHLHGYLKVRYHQGIPYFKFSLNCREQVLVARLWKLGSGFNWSYTFHSISNVKRKNLSDWGLSNCSNESSLIGQMQVSCKSGSVSDNSMVTEFVLYDIFHARLNSFSDKNGNVSSSSVSCLVDESFEMKSGNKRCLNHCPCLSEDLHTGLEIAAIVVELPYAERESLKYRRGDIRCETKESSMLTWPVSDNKTGRGTVKVVIPNGHHSLGTRDSSGPSSLLERWRLGGQCDCGGWDMACSLTVLTNEQSKGDDHNPLELHQMGSREETPAMKFCAVRNGKYIVDFHAKLSTLQAFSICVAMLHTSEGSCGSQQVVNYKFDESNSVAIFIQDEGFKAAKGSEKSQEPPLFIASFPSSPISRV